MMEKIKYQLASETLLLTLKRIECAKLDLNKFIEEFKQILTTNEYSDLSYALRLIANSEYWVNSAYKSLLKR